MFKLCQFPVPIRRHERLNHVHPINPTNFKTDSSQKCTSSNPCPTTLSLLNSLYGIQSNTGLSSLSQAVFETNAESFDPMDLTAFQMLFNVPLQDAKVVGMTPYLSGLSCLFGFCVEGNLDIQYIMGLARNSVGIFWYTDLFYAFSSGDPFLDFLIQIYQTPNPPTSLSISWGTDEINYLSFPGGSSLIDAFNLEAMKLGLLGITIVVASGDSGVSGANCSCDEHVDSNTFKEGFWNGKPYTGKGYFPDHPASSPYVVSVSSMFL